MPSQAFSSNRVERSTLTSFIETFLPNSLIINTIHDILHEKISKYCSEPNNYQKQIYKIFYNLLTFNMNTKNILRSFIHKYSPTAAVVIPSQLPIMYPATMSDSDFYNNYKNLLRSNIEMDELKLLILMIENEKTNLCRMCKEFLPVSQKLPSFLKFDILYSDNREKQPPEVLSHPELPNEIKSTPPTPRPTVVIRITNKPSQPRATSRHVQSDSASLPSNPTPPDNNNFPNEINLRKKRSVNYWYGSDTYYKNLHFEQEILIPNLTKNFDNFSSFAAFSIVHTIASRLSLSLLFHTFIFLQFLLNKYFCYQLLF